VERTGPAVVAGVVGEDPVDAGEQRAAQRLGSAGEHVQSEIVEVSAAIVSRTSVRGHPDTADICPRTADGATHGWAARERARRLQ
jgi:hypothetical protein